MTAALTRPVAALAAFAAIALSGWLAVPQPAHAGGMCQSAGHGVKCCWVKGADGVYRQVCRKGV